MTAIWYDAPSHAAGAALVARLGGVAAELRQLGVRVRAPQEQATHAARELGLVANPAGLQRLGVVVETMNPPAVRAFWETVLGYEQTADGLADPLQRDPAFSVRRLAEPRPLRNRIHVDVVRPEAAVLRARETTGREPTGPFGVMLPDDEGNEVDLVPGGTLPGTTDWQTLFGAMTFYRTTTPEEASRFVTTVAELADNAEVPLMLDVRPEGVVVDSGKDRWEDGDSADPKFVALAQQIETAAKDLGLRADPAPLRFVQFGIDAIDIPAVRAFWAALLGYVEDERPYLSDLYDPRRLNPVLFFQQLDEPREQRNRIRFELAVPDRARKLETALAAGGRVRSENPYLLADPEGNEVLLTT
ncbi:VOC family protein [Kribbella sp. HUAS MG21]|uniref:VOC family protein n=1 Tax=Kribbella sp. HUAS MG21 TaxID=3160966 RepID=A0AAU7TP85_9ACTN